MDDRLDLIQKLKKLELRPEDTVLIHGDAGIAAQYIKIPTINRIGHLFGELFKYFRTGTIVVPAFTYSFTKNEAFNVQRTSSTVGLFSEYFRNLPGVARSKNPLFSVCSFGKYANDFRDSSKSDAFGKDTAFDILEKLDGKILCLGCSLDRITFTHHVEQIENVPYRYFKYFHGIIEDEGESYDSSIRYFVRNLEIESEICLETFKLRGIKQNLISHQTLGRFPIYSVGARDFRRLSTELLKEDIYSLTKMRGTQNDF